MRIKKFSSICLVAMLTLSLAMITVHAGVYPGDSDTTIWVDDQNAHFESASNLTCTHFNVSVMLQNAPASPHGVRSWEFHLSYNTTLLNATYVYRPPAWVGGGYSWLPTKGGIWYPDQSPTINRTIGYVWVGCVNPVGSELTGNYTLVTIDFHIIYAPPQGVGMNITVTDSQLIYDEFLYETDQVTTVPHDVINGTYSYKRLGIIPGAPTAEFTYPPVLSVCQTGTVDASPSTNGTGNIISWDWTLTGPATWTSSNNMSTRTFHCDGPGDVDVTLVVTNDVPLSSLPTTHRITQITVAGPQIDLYDGPWRQYPEGTYTPYNGTGPGIPCDSYAPGENISLYAKVTYNGEIVQNILVGFEVWDPLNRCVTYRTDPTNETGIAHVWFRIPIPCSPAEQLDLFGHWQAIAKCKLQDEIINDTKSFKVGWIVEIIDLKTFPYTTWYKGQYIDINVTVKNIAWLPRLVWLTVVIYDECSVPIGQAKWDFVISPATPLVICGSFVTSQITSIYVPKWAYVGAATVYANAYTALPFNCGIPYCPEVSYPIVIKA